jgi:hypothetical protein
MQSLQNLVFGRGINPVDNNGTATSGVAFDTRSLGGTGSVACIVSVGNCAGATTLFKLQESDDNFSSDTTDITGGGFTALTSGSDNTLHGAFVAIDGTRKRYLRVVITNDANAALVSAIWIGAKNCQSPNSATERGLTQQLVIG